LLWGATNCQCCIALDVLEGTLLTEHRGVLDPCSRHTCDSTAMLLPGDAQDVHI